MHLANPILCSDEKHKKYAVTHMAVKLLGRPEIRRSVERIEALR